MSGDIIRLILRNRGNPVIFCILFEENGWESRVSYEILFKRIILVSIEGIKMDFWEKWCVDYNLNCDV
jgi:hypothetical protein